jgi:geranylgeranyl diphosphate synthase type II
MDAMALVERSLSNAFKPLTPGDEPPSLIRAMRYAIFPGGARIRPRLCLAVAHACASELSPVAIAAAASIELLHCASLVHDDLPCFDDAPTRRGRASVHRAFGQPLAVLVGDALIVLAFETIAKAGAACPRELAALTLIVARSVGAPHGIAAGQAWEQERQIPLATYQRAKTGALFAAATAAGACAAGQASPAWHALGERIGEAYQVADDLRDVLSSEQDLGKPVRRDRALGRPNVVHELGLAGAISHLKQLVNDGLDSIPACEGADQLRAHILSEAERLLPRQLARPAA